MDETTDTELEGLRAAVTEVEAMQIPMGDDGLRYQHFQTLILGRGLAAIAEAIREGGPVFKSANQR